MEPGAPPPTQDPQQSQGPAIHPTADQAVEAYLRQIRKTARRGTDFEAVALGLLLLFLADDVTRAVAKRIEPFKISEKKLDALLLFTADAVRGEIPRPPTPTSIADYMNVSRASATGLLDWLEERNLIARKNHPTDRRSIQTEITSKGRDLVAKILPTYSTACEDLTSFLSERDRTDLHRVLSKVWNHIKHIESR